MSPVSMDHFLWPDIAVFCRTPRNIMWPHNDYTGCWLKLQSAAAAIKRAYCCIGSAISSLQLRVPSFSDFNIAICLSYSLWLSLKIVTEPPSRGLKMQLCCVACSRQKIKLLEVYEQRLLTAPIRCICPCWQLATGTRPVLPRFWQCNPTSILYWSQNM